jgi:hypothetical protein
LALPGAQDAKTPGTIHPDDGCELEGQSVRVVSDPPPRFQVAIYRALPPGRARKKAAAASGRSDRIGDPDPTRRVTWIVATQRDVRPRTRYWIWI